MARLPLVDPGDPDLPPGVREIVDRFGGADGFTGLPNIMRAVANHPDGKSVWTAVDREVHVSGVLPA